MYVKFQTPVPVITEGHNAIAVIKRRVISYRAPFEVTVSLERYTGPLQADEGAIGDTGMNYYIIVYLISIFVCRSQFHRAKEYCF